jgi:hypothetical protein
MDEYNKLLNTIVDGLRKKDEQDRKSKKLSSVRSDIESILYRNHFDTFYTEITDTIIKPYGILELSAPFVFGEMDINSYHKFLNDHLVLPHAIAKYLDYQTNSRGINTDIAKICNLLALLKRASEKPDIGKPKIVTLFNGLKEFSFGSAFSQNGMETGFFLYWLLYDDNCRNLNWNILIDLAEATKGSFGDFKNFIFAYWTIRAGSPKESVKFFYEDLLPHIKI